MAWQPNQRYSNRRGYRPKTTKYNQRGYKPRGRAVYQKKRAKVKVSVKNVLYKGRDFNKVMAIVKKFSKVVRKRGWKLEVIGNPDDPNYTGDYIVRVIKNPQDDIVVESVRIK